MVSIFWDGYFVIVVFVFNSLLKLIQLSIVIKFVMIQLLLFDIHLIVPQ